MNSNRLSHFYINLIFLYLKDAVFIPINNENNFEKNNKFPSQSMNPKDQDKFSKPQVEVSQPTKDEMGSFFSPNKIVKNTDSSSQNDAKLTEPTAQVLPYDFRPGALDIFGEVKGKSGSSENSVGPTEEDFKYESENDLESILNVPSEYLGNVTGYIILIIHSQL